MNSFQFAMIAAVAVGFSTVSACAPAANATELQPAEVIVTIVTNLPFDASKVIEDMKLVQQVIDEFQKSQGLDIDFQHINNAAENKNGKFAVTYATSDYCQRVTSFVKGAKSATDKVSYAIIRCPGKEAEVL